MKGVFDKKKILQQSLSCYDDFCMGYGTPGVSGNGYLIGLSLSVGAAQASLSHSGSQQLDGTHAFDLAETACTYLGQINMITVSSFCGPSGMIWGHDLARSPKLGQEKIKFSNDAYPFKGNVYSIDPLLESLKALYGTVDQKVFPLLAGAHVPCAEKTTTLVGPVEIYAGMAVAIPTDREKDACLLMEDVGTLQKNSSKDIVLCNLISSILAVGKNQQVEYETIYAGLRSKVIAKGEVGCALAAVPYFTLAKRAIIKNTGGTIDWKSMDHLDEWIKSKK